MKKINIPRIIWVSSIFIILIISLLLVMKYKINYEYLSFDYLYFYECEDNLCVSESKDNNHLIYSKYECGYDICPKYLKKLDDKYVILEKNSKYILYDYRLNKVVSDSYSNYEVINNNYIIVSNNSKKGIIKVNGEVVVNTIYEDIGYRNNEYLTGYNLNNIIVKNNNLYGIISFKDGKIIEEIKYKTEEINTLLELLKKQ